MGDENNLYEAFQTLSDRSVLLKFAKSFLNGKPDMSSDRHGECDLKSVKLCLNILSQPHILSVTEKSQHSHDSSLEMSRKNVLTLVSDVLNKCKDMLNQLFHQQALFALEGEDRKSKTDLPLLIDIIILCVEILGQGFIHPETMFDLMNIILERLNHLCEGEEVYQAAASETKNKETTDLLSLFVGLVRFMPIRGQPDRTVDDILCRMLDLLRSCNCKIATFIMVHIFPVILGLGDPDVQLKMLKYVWDIICAMFSTGSTGIVCEKYISAYVMLCSFCNILFTQGLWLKFPAHDDVMFWKILQYGLVHENCLTRKRALYVFKGFLSSVEHDKADIVGPISDAVPIFFWKTECLAQVRSAWEDVVLLFEVFEEKQIHVIKPILHKLNKIVRISAKSAQTDSLNFHTSWLVLLFCRLLCHESKSIVHWTVAWVLELNVSECPILEQSSSELFICSVIEALNDSSLYARSEQRRCMDDITWQNVAGFLNRCCDALLEQDKKAAFLQRMLRVVSHQSWSGVALLYLSCALSKIKPIPAWEKTDFPSIREVIYHSQRTQEPLLRGAIQCYLLQSILHLMNCKDVTFEDLSGLLSVFKGNESLIRHTSQWSHVSLWLSSTIASQDFEALGIQSASSFCTDSIRGVLELPGGIADDGIKRLARMIVLLSDAGVICVDAACSHSQQCVTWPKLIAPVVYNLLTAPTRPYLPGDKFLRSLLFYSHLLEESKGHQNQNELQDETTVSIVKCLEDPKDMINFIFLGVFDALKNVTDIVKLKVHVKALYALSAEEQLHSVLVSLSPSFVEKCSEILEKDASRSLLLQLWKALAWICHFLFSSRSAQNLPSVCETVKSILVHIVEKELLTYPFQKPDFVVDNISKAEWIKLTNKATVDAWFCVRTVLACFPPQGDATFLRNFADESLETLCTGAQCAVASVFSCVKLIMPKIIENDPQLLSDIVTQGWKSCLELRRSDLFRPTLRAFVAMVFQPNLTKNPFADIANKYVREFKEIGENSSGIFNIVVDHCCSEDFMHTEFDFTKLMVDSLTFGPVHRKDQRTVEDAVSFVTEQGNDLAVNALLSCDNKSDTLVRVKALNFIQSMKLRNPDDQHFAMHLVMALIEVDAKLNQSQSVHFGNCFTHRMKNRVWQSVLLLQPFLLQDDNEALLMRTYEFLTSGNQQPSVRYLQEWIVFKIIYSCPILIDTLHSFMEKASDKRQGRVTSLLSVLVHLSHHVSDLEKFANEWLPNIISYCMVQYFNIRVYAQVALEQLWHLCESRKLDGVLQKYDFVSGCLQSFASANCGNAGKNKQKLAEDFYFKSFDPVKDFTLQTLFYELPRLSNLTCEEWISPSVFQSHSTASTSSFIALRNCDSRMQECNPSLWLTKSAMDADSSEDTADALNFQKKITPWTQMISDIDISLKKKPPISDGLVVVASLIDKAPNLGGLCRTSEVFGVSEFVIGSLKYVEDKQFQNLAVTANKWVSIREVKPYHLKDYLFSLKQKGYCLIGAEQTDDSQPLMKYVFPKKSVILLGNEKEGLPVDLIQVLDVCVQIPQQGIIRSLNVHVCGAILIWEYARQHMISDKS